MGIAGKPALEGPGRRVPNFCEPMLGSGDCFQLVVNIFGRGIESQKESLFTFFRMVRSGFVDEAESASVPNYIHNLAQVQGPESERMDLDGNDFANRDASSSICNAHPAQIELLPRFELLCRSLKSAPTLPDPGSSHIMDESNRQLRDLQPAPRIE